MGDRLGSKLGSSRNELSYTRRRILELMEIDARISIMQISVKLGVSTTARGIQQPPDGGDDLPR